MSRVHGFFFNMYSLCHIISIDSSIYSLLSSRLLSFSDAGLRHTRRILADVLRAPSGQAVAPRLLSERRGRSHRPPVMSLLFSNSSHECRRRGVQNWQEVAQCCKGPKKCEVVFGGCRSRARLRVPRTRHPSEDSRRANSPCQ